MLFRFDGCIDPFLGLVQKEGEATGPTWGREEGKEEFKEGRRKFKNNKGRKEGVTTLEGDTGDGQEFKEGRKLKNNLRKERRCHNSS